MISPLLFSLVFGAAAGVAEARAVGPYLNFFLDKSAVAAATVPGIQSSASTAATSRMLCPADAHDRRSPATGALSRR